MASWVLIDDTSDFSLQNLPYGIFSTSSLDARIGVAVGNSVLDLKALAQHGVLSSLGFDVDVLQEPTLNSYASLGRSVHRDVRIFLQELLNADTSIGHLLRDDAGLREVVLVPMEQVEMHLPMTIGDYTDFFVGPHHAKNCSDIFRPGTGMPASFYKMPLGYHGRASSIVVSGTPVYRPRGQFLDKNNQPFFGPSRKLDFEVEFAAFIGQGTKLGQAIEVDDAEEHIFGFVLLNDWSARDIQRMEAQPLGPFNGKNFCSTISPWIVTPDAIDAHRSKSLHKGEVLPYLQENRQDSVHDIKIDVDLEGKSLHIGGAAS